MLAHDTTTLREVGDNLKGSQWGAVIVFCRSDLLIRPCEPADLTAVLKIENASYPRPWSEQQFLQELQAPYARVDLLLQRNDLAGYVCYWLAADELHILNIATGPDFRRLGIAHKLLEHVFQEAKALDVRSALLEVRSGNIAAISLYRKFGFVDDCIRPAYYSDGEDALLMSCPLGSPF
jgi:ribosomal-protein-alanine N-acetyltransferase